MEVWNTVQNALENVYGNAIAHVTGYSTPSQPDKAVHCPTPQVAESGTMTDYQAGGREHVLRLSEEARKVEPQRESQDHTELEILKTQMTYRHSLRKDLAPLAAGPRV